MHPSKLYSEPEIYPKDPTSADMKKVWFINVRFYDVRINEWVQKPFKKGINRYHNFSERLFEAKALKEVVKEQLEKGWNPLTGEYPVQEIDPLTAINELSLMPFRAAVKFGFENCAGSPRTLKNYKSCYMRIMRQSPVVSIPGYNRTFDLSQIPINQITRTHISFLLDHCKKEFKWSNKAFNKHMGYFRAVIGRLESKGIIQANPAGKIAELPTKETKKFIAYTEEEKKIIQEHLYLNHYGFFIYLLVIYHTGMRCNEVLAIKIKDIDFERKVINVIPDEERDNSKTSSIRVVPLVDSLFNFIREWVPQNYSPEYYLFGSPFTSGRGNAGSSKTGKGAMHCDYFKPSLVRIKRDTVTRLWKKIIIDKLQIRKYLYAAKHTGGDDKILAGIDLEALKQLYGHSSKYMTAEYVSKLKEVYRNQIREKAPEF